MPLRLHIGYWCNGQLFDISLIKINIYVLNFITTSSARPVLFIILSLYAIRLFYRVNVLKIEKESNKLKNALY